MIEADKLGGGQSLMICVNDIIKNLTHEEVRILRSEKFKFRIPFEFAKNSSEVNECRIISADNDILGHVLCRYRQDIVMNRDSMDSKLKSALDSFDSLIHISDSKIIKYHVMAKNDIILMDNTRWLHGRTEILDQHRHLVRIRFQAKYGELLPEFA